MARLAPELLDASRYSFRVEIATRYADLDPNGHINNVAMAAAFEDARLRFDAAIGHADLYAKLRVMIVAAHIDYLAEAHYPTPLEVSIGLIAFGRTSWTVGELASQEGRPRAFCRATLVCTDGGRPTPLPQGFRELLEQVQLKGV